MPSREWEGDLAELELSNGRLVIVRGFPVVLFAQRQMRMGITT
jgi:hypothetical protein